MFTPNNKLFWKKLLVMLLVIVFVVGSLPATFMPQIAKAADEENVFYVSSSGSDADMGTKDSPFATIGKAIESVPASGTGTVILLGDITLNATLITNASGKSVTLMSDEGKKFKIARGTGFSGTLININGGNITLKNLIIDGQYIEATNIGINVNSNAVTVFEDMEISNHINAGGGGTSILMASGAKIFIKGNTLIHNNEVKGRAEDNPPSILGAGSGGVVTIESGVITENSITEKVVSGKSIKSNGVVVGIGLSSKPRFVMTGGKIIGNILNGDGLNTAVTIDNDPIGTTTVGNVAVYMRGTAAQAEFQFGGNAFVYNNFNTAGEQRNVFLKNKAARDNAYLTLIQAMEDGAKVGVFARTMPDKNDNPIVDIAIGGSGYTAKEKDAEYFVTDINTQAAVAYEEATKKVVLDYRDPVDLEVTDPGEGQTVSIQPTISGTGTPDAKVTIELVNKSNPSEIIKEEVTVKPDGTWEFKPSTNLTPGSYTLKVTATKEGVSAGPITKNLKLVELSGGKIPGGGNVQPALWLKANDGASKDGSNQLTNWTDKAGENTFTLDIPAGHEAKTPKYNEDGVNFNPSVRFDNLNSTNHYNQSAKLIGDKKITFQSGFAVYKWPSSGNAGALVGSVETINYGAQVLGGESGAFAVGTGATSVWRSFGAPDRSRYQIVNYEINDTGTNPLARVDGQQTSINRTNNFTRFTFTPVIGATAGTSNNNWLGLRADVAEIILYDSETNVDVTKIETYLAVKYGITLGNGEEEYVATNGETVWSPDLKYKHNIAGIAHDSKEDLLQKQSRSINLGTQVVIGIGTLADTNEANNGLLTDKQYLIWGDNGSELKFTKQIGNTDKNHAERIWKVQNTGSVGEVNIAIPKASVPTGTTLLVGESETDFTNATSHPMTEVTIGGTDYYVTKATLANGQYFTFAADVLFPQSVKMEKDSANQNQIVVTFDKDIKLTASEATGFTVTVGTETITLTDADVKLDPVNPKRLLITLPAGTDTTGKLVKVEYDGQGNLTGTHNVPVNKFEKDVINVDKTALQNKVDEVKMLEEGNYTPDSWLELQEALKEAERVLKDPDVTQEQVEAALENLKQAEQDLVLVKPVPTTAVLEQSKDGNKIAVEFNKTITLTNLTGFTIHIEGVEMTPTGYEVVGDKLVLTFPGNPDVTDKAVKVKYDGTGNLQGTNGTAIEQFELPVEDSYSSAFQITQPDAVTAKPQPTIGGKVDVTTTPSTVTIVLKNDKDEPLLVDVAATVDPSTGEWTFTPPTDLPDGTYTVIATATNGQQTVTKKHTFTVATTPIVNKVPLQQKVEEAKNLVAGEYTPASWSNYQTALNKAKEILAKPNATLEEVDKALAALTGAQNALVKIGKGLGTLTPSTGTLSPSFQTGVTDYTMTVEYPTSVIDFTAIPVEAGATVTTTVNGQPGAIGQIPLQVGENIIVISVKDANGNVRQYTIKVYRDAYTGGGSWTPNPTQPVTPTPTPGDTKTKIRVELEIDGEKPLEKTTVEIERTKHANGDITDFVALTEANAKEAVAKAKEIGNNIARIVLPDVNDEVKEAKVEIPKESLKLLRENGLSLEISSENGHIAIPVSSMEGIDDNFYFRLVPVKKESERQAIEERARAERVVRETLQSNDVHVVARPMTIETNMPSRPVQVTLPLKGVKIPTGAAEREAFLKQLAVFIEHSDGEKKVVIPEVVTMAKDELGLRFTVEKFSTFTIIQVNKKEETKPPLEVKEHEAYIKGFPDGTFGPEKNVTRAQVATMIARILGYTDGPVNTAPFKDIPSDHYAAGAIAFVKERGIMNGDVNGNFRASENITRAQMATVVANYKQLSIKENVAITFNDTKGHWAQWIIEANRAAGIINGRQDGSFAPDEHLTRAQAVVMMNRMFERGPLQGVTTPSFPDVKATHWAFDDIEEAAKSHEYYMDEDENEQLSK